MRPNLKIVLIMHYFVFFKESLKQFFQNWDAVKRYREVIIFTVGLMKDPKPLVEHIYEIHEEWFLNGLRTDAAYEIDVELFTSIYTESTVQLPDHPLHNKYCNFYDHGKDDRMNRSRDITPIFHPSRLYDFNHIKQEVKLNTDDHAGAEIPECAIYIDGKEYDEAATKKLLATCCRISRKQPVSDLYLYDVTCEDFTDHINDTIRMSNKVRSLSIDECVLPEPFIRDLLRSCVDCGDSLQKLTLYRMNLSPFEPLLNELLEKLADYHKTGGAQRELTLWLGGSRKHPTDLSEQFEDEWTKRCRGIPSIDWDIDNYLDDGD